MAVEPEWRDLWAHDPQATPFQHPAWLLPWWKHFGSGELLSFGVYDGGRLCALALMFLHEWEGRRQITFLGNGVSDSLNLLGGPAGPVLEALSCERRRWDLADLQDLPAESGFLTTATPLRSQVCPQYVCSAIPLPATTAEFHEALPSGLRRNLRRYRTHLEAEGAVSLETATDSTFSEFFEALLRLHRARRGMKDDAGMLEGSFHPEAARSLWREGLVRLHGLRLRGQLCAVVYALHHGNRAYSYQGGFDPALARFSPGSLILEYAICQAIRESLEVFDFLRGEERYKLDWGAVFRSTYRLLLWPEL